VVNSTVEVIEKTEAVEKIELTQHWEMILSVLLFQIVRQKVSLFFQIVCRGSVPSKVSVKFY
jgi:hypothetical protein